uniref:Uncharacterized protein n=1 Tax=Labrus bergylta TaxID=56723 RepID=A0A3Q3E666_9LABR
MQTNTRKLHSVQPRPVGPSKQVCKVPTRRVPYRVGYSWNRGGRLKELRIRHLARKFLKIWIHRTFGRVLPHKAKSHYNSVVLRRAWEGWKDEWWTSRREWSLTMRAECHYRYYLYNLVFHHWRIFVSLQRTEKSKLQNAQLFGMIMAYSVTGYFILIGIRNTLLIPGGNLVVTVALHTIQQKDCAWLQWKESHTTALCQKERESKAALHFMLSLKRKSLYCWKCYISIIQTKKESQGKKKKKT